MYAARADLAPLMIEGFERGGQLMLTTDVENYPGFPDGIMGPDLMEQFRKQAERFGTRIVAADVTRVDFSSSPFQVWVGDERHLAETVVISTGASARWLGVPGEERLRGHGVSACATCDGFFFRDRRLVVIGGGDSAMEEATFLTKFASHVTVVHRRDEFRASKIMANRVLSHERIDVVWDTVIEEILGDETVTGVRTRNVVTGETGELAADGVFVAIGHTPNTDVFAGQIDTDDAGYILTRRGHHPDERARGLRRRRRGRQGLPAGGDRRRDGLSGGARRRALAREPPGRPWLTPTRRRAARAE